MVIANGRVAWQSEPFVQVCPKALPVSSLRNLDLLFVCFFTDVHNLLYRIISWLLAPGEVGLGQEADGDLQVQNAVEAGDAKAALAKRNSGVMSPRQLAEVEAAQAAAQAALLAELALMRQQKASAEEQARRADHLVRHLTLAAFLSNNQISAQAASHRKVF